MARLRCVEIAKELLRDGTDHANRSLQAVIPIQEGVNLAGMRKLTTSMQLHSFRVNSFTFVSLVCKNSIYLSLIPSF
jgi:hypothetical protein